MINLPSFADSYEIHARYIPVAALGLAIAFALFLLEIEYPFANNLPITSQWAINTVVVIILALISDPFAKVGKYIEHLCYKKDGVAYYPTTKLLAEKNESNSILRDSAFKIIQVVYKVDLSKKKKNHSARIAEINQVVSFIRGEVGQEKMVLRANRIYGFCRNLLGGFILYFVFILGLGLFHFGNPEFPWNKAFYLLIATIVIAMAFWLQMRKAGEEYAQALLNTFIVKFKNYNINEQQ